MRRKKIFLVELFACSVFRLALFHFSKIIVTLIVKMKRVQIDACETGAGSVYNSLCS